MRKIGIMISILGAATFAALLAWGLVGSSSVQADETCSPVIPGTYNGTVTIDGAAAPDGVTITATGVVEGSEIVFGTGTTSGGRYQMNVPEPMPSKAPCFPGGTVTFKAASQACTPTPTFNGGIQDKDLTCAAVPATATATAPAATATAPAATATAPAATVTATAVAPPITGAGGTSGDGGFLWWPLALAAAALTSVAGLATARWARR